MSVKRIFETTKKGTLVEIEPDKIESTLKNRAVKLVHIGAIYVLLTAEEEAKLKADRQAIKAKKKAREEASKSKPKDRTKGVMELTLEVRKLRKRIKELEG